MTLSEEALKIQEELRKIGRFSKYCSDCGEKFGSDDMDTFLEMMDNHNKKCKAIKQQN